MPLNTPIDTRVAPGSNEAIDYAKLVTDRIASEYVGLTNTLDELVNEIPKLPEQVQSDADALMIGALIKRMRDLDSRVESVRTLEKEPYLRGGNAVDSFFNGMRDQIGKRNKNDRNAKDGYTDLLQARINDYQNKKLAEERARREAERVAAERAAQEAARKAREEAQAAEEARLKAERARNVETIAANRIKADQQAAAAAVAQQQAADALQAAEDARLATYAKPADMARVRGNAEAGGGVTLTVAQEPYAMVTDRSQLNWALIAPFFTDAEVEKALRAWARTTGHRVKMAGAEIGFRNKGVTR
jgi:hypothetical protein